MQNPVLVEVVRSPVVESCHRGSAVVVDSCGKVVFSIGDIDRLIYPRSALKPLQAIPLIESGAAEYFDLSAQEIALSCASHNSEAMHLKVVNEWLEKLQLKSANLECGAELPNFKDSAHALISAGKKPDKAHHNCSGKHMAMLTIAKHLLPEVQGYSAHSHIVQQVWMHTLSQLIDEDVSTMQWEQDGCGLPAIYMPMQKLASAFALFSEPVKQPGARGMAMNNIVQAIIANPLMIAGSKRCCSAVIEETKGSAIVKAGAEGVYAGVIPQLKIGFALKIDDGATLASEVALGALLKKIGAINQSEENNLSAFFNPSIYNSLGHITGEIRAASAWS